MYSYLESLPQWLETLIVIIFLFITIALVTASIIFTAKIVKKIKDIKISAAGAELDIKIEAPTTDTEEVKPAEGAEK